MNEIVRFTRIGRMYKLIKLAKLLRILKVLRNRSNIMKQVEESLKIGVGMQRLIFFFFMFIVFTHICACLWIMAAGFNDSKDDPFSGTWMDNEVNGKKYNELSVSEQYITSAYYTITTITTVGYGDISGVTVIEKCFCIVTMIIGVISFSFASGSLASII